MQSRFDSYLPHQVKLSDHKNSKKQGDAGMGAAIAHFTSLGIMVAIPLTDSQEYDLIIEEDNILKKIQVKTTDYKTKYGIYAVELTTKGGNKSGQTTKKFDPTKVDYLFILTNEYKYIIPATQIEVRTKLNLGIKYNYYRL